MVAERAHVLELHDLEQRILDDGERDARRDVGDLCALFLRLLDLRIHEDRAARAEVDGRFRADGELCKLGRRHVQALGEVLDERAAARRARLVERDVADAAVFDEEAFHVLPADVEHERDLRAELLRRAQVGERLDLAAVRMDAGLHNGLAITRRHAAGHMRLFRQYLVKVLQLRDDALEWRAVVAAIGRIQEFLVLADGRDLRRGRTRVDAEIDRPLVMLEITARHLVAVVARLERRIVRFVGEQREVRLARLAGRRFFRAADGIFETRSVDGLRLVRKRGAHRDEIVAVFEIDRMLLVEAERLDEALLELGQEMERPAEERDMAVDRTSLREVADRLVDDGLQDGKRDVGLLRTIIHECLDVRLCKDAAARGDRVDLFAFRREVVQPFRVRRQERRHMIDERARAARTDAIHALLRRRAEVRDLRILAAELDNRVRLRDEFLDSRRARDDLLHEWQADALGDAHASRARQCEVEFLLADNLLERCEILMQCVADF